MTEPLQTEQAEKVRIGELMVTEGLISQDQLRIALIEQKRSQLQLGQQLVQLGFVSESIVRDLVADNLGHESIDLELIVADVEALRMVPEAFARRYHLFPVAYDVSTNTLTIAMFDMFNVVALDQLRAILDSSIHLKPVLAAETQLTEAIDQFYDYELSIDGILQEIETGEIDGHSLVIVGDTYTQPMVRLVGALLMDAVKRGVSDIHFEPESVFLRIRYRIDGVLRQVRSLHKSYWPSIVVRLKVMSSMDIAETRAAQDGRINMYLCGRPIDFRVSTQPTIHGENIVLRVLDRVQSEALLNRLALNYAKKEALQLMMSRPEGVLVVTGPTGSGKTTTLYSLLSEKNTEAVNIMTLEDPVEYPMPLMRQTSVSEMNKVDFANGIRSMMRQDPDIILVGEMRDEETAKMALRAAMTGHQVFTTLHTNSALGVFSRLVDMGVSHEMMAGNMIGIIAQRLVRKLCGHCKMVSKPTAAERKILGMQHEGAEMFKAQGCEYCDFTGYKGRVAIMELLRIDAEMDALIARHAYVGELSALAIKTGFVSLAQDGLHHVLKGVTSLEEVMRVVDLTSHIEHQAH